MASLRFSPWINNAGPMLLAQPEVFAVRGAVTESLLPVAVGLSLRVAGVLRSHASALNSALVKRIEDRRRKRGCDMRGNLVPCSAPSIEEEL